MALTPRLELRTSQSLVMTPQLQQAIKMLQLTNLELAAYVEQEMERNPLLQHEDEAPATDEAPAGDDRAEAADFLADAEGSPEIESDNLWDADGPGAAADAQGGEWGPSPGPAAGAASAPKGGAGDGDEPDLESTLAESVSLRQHLERQVGLSVAEGGDRLIALQLIDSLDPAGYLADDCETLAAGLGCAVADVDRVLRTLQEFDPPGLFARDLRECLALQLKDRNRLDPAMEALLANLDRLARGDIAGLMRLCGVDRADLSEMVAEIRALDPKPAHSFEGVAAEPVIPDIFMRAAPDGGWIVELNGDTLPRVLVDSAYYAVVSRQARNKDERQFISGCFQSATWLVKALHQRATTILKVASEIVRQQDGFFRHGVRHLRPLVLRDIAGAVEMHESTVSRVTTNKFMATPRGLFELKYFFTSALAAHDGGDAVSSETVRQRIRELIEAEGAGSVLSDDRLAEILRAEGIDVARRTVAKYRESLGLGSSVQRRRARVRVI